MHLVALLHLDAKRRVVMDEQAVEMDAKGVVKVQRALALAHEIHLHVGDAHALEPGAAREHVCIRSKVAARKEPYPQHNLNAAQPVASQIVPLVLYVPPPRWTTVLRTGFEACDQRPGITPANAASTAACSAWCCR